MKDDPLAQLEQLLRDERAAIGRLDGAVVLAFARRKQELIAAIHGGRGGGDRAGGDPASNGRSGDPMTAESAARLRSLLPAIRHNGVLLAHARDILRDALAAAGVAPPAKRAISNGMPVRRLLSVRG